MKYKIFVLVSVVLVTGVAYAVLQPTRSSASVYVNRQFGFQLEFPTAWFNRAVSESGPWEFQNVDFSNNLNGLGIPPSGNMWLEVAKGICNEPKTDYVHEGNILQQTLCKDGFQITIGLWNDDPQLAEHAILLKNIVSSSFHAILSSSTPAIGVGERVSSSTSAASGTFSLNERFNNGVCDIHIFNTETKKENIIHRAVENAQFEDCDSYCSPSMSVDGQYVVNDCGTSPIRNYSFFRVTDGHHIQSVSAHRLLWIDATQALLDAVQPSNGWFSMCTSGKESGIVKVNVATGQITVLEQADRTHSYSLGSLAPDGIIRYTLNTLPESCSQQPTATYWKMDMNGKTSN